METLMIGIMCVIGGAAIGWLSAHLIARGAAERLRRENISERAAHREEQAALRAQLESAQTAAQMLETTKSEMSQAFEAAAANAIRNNSNQFLTLAQENLGRTMEQAKGQLDARQRVFEELVKPLAENYQKLDPRLESLAQLTTGVATAADRLTGALQNNRQIGSWGEIQLRRIVELAGMLEYCDFTEQQTVAQSADRPDLTVRLPEQRAVVIDAKASTAAFMEAQQAEDEKGTSEALAKHAQAMRTQVDDLASKKYGEKVEGSLDFVVMFIPGDQLLSAALAANPGLVEYAINKRVAIATPSTLISLLWAVANGWQRYRVADQAKTVLEVGAEMHRRMTTFINHYETAGKRLDSAVEAYNRSIQSFDARVMPQARRFSGLIANDENALNAPATIDRKSNTSRNATGMDEDGEQEQLKLQG